MATQPNRLNRDIVDFPPNVPVTVALKYPQGKAISNQYGERFMFSLADNRVMFLDPDVAGQIASLGVNAGQHIAITKRTNGRKDSPVTWTVARAIGEQADGTLVVPALPAAQPEPAPRKQPGHALVDEANALVDAYAEVLARTLTTYEGRIKPEEARALLISAYIQRCKFSGAA